MRFVPVALFVLLAGCSSPAPKPQPAPEEKGPATVLVAPFDVPDKIHDGVKLEVERWPGLIAEGSKKDDAVRFMKEADEPRYTLSGRVRSEDKGKKLTITAELQDNRTRERVWGEGYELTEFPKKVEWLDETRGKIVEGARMFVKERVKP